MSISVVCQCGKKFQAKDEHAGAKTKCPVCGQPLTIPKPGDAKPATPSSPSSPAPAPVAAAAKQQPPATQKTSAAPPKSRPTYEGKQVGDWLDLLEVNDPASRKHAAAVLSTIGPEAGTELSVFIQRLEAEHVLIRHWAVTCLERLGPLARPALDALMKRLDDEEPLIREKSVTAMEKVEPGCAAFVARLRQGLKDKRAENRASAIAAFRRDMKTLGVSRTRFWTCPCGSVYEKEDLEERLKLLADGGPAKWDGTRGCKKCGKQHTLRDIYTGKQDVPQKFWPQLIKRFGDRVRVPDDFLTDPAQPQQSYQLSESHTFDSMPSIPLVSSMSVIDGPMDVTGETFTLAAPVVALHGPPQHTETEEETELVPGAVVPKSGKYKCTACHKLRASHGKSTAKIATVEQTKTFIKYFKAGKTFAECPHCGDISEWEFVE